MALDGISNEWTEDTRQALVLLKRDTWMLGLTRFSCHMDWCWRNLLPDVMVLGLMSLIDRGTLQDMFSLIHSLGFTDFPDWDSHIIKILKSWCTSQLLPR